MSMERIRMIVKNERGPVRRLFPACLLGLVLSATAMSAQATPPLPTTFEIEERPIQRVPTRFKLQARVSQGKIPTGDATFQKVIVNLKNGVKTLCSETLNNVRVRDSVINIDIGPSMANCQLDDTIAGVQPKLEDVVANYAELEFQICINNEESCLKPILVSSVPFAVKSSFAAQAQEAHLSDLSAQSHYAHRATADRDLLLGGQIGSGYYDFHSPAANELLMIDGQSVSGGYIQWTPVNSENKLSIASKNNDTEQLRQLAELALHAQLTRVGGALRVSGNEDVLGMLSVTQSASVGGELQVSGPSHLTNSLTVQGATNLGSGLTLAGNSSFASGGKFTFDGDVVFKGSVTLPSVPMPGNSVGTDSVIDGSLQSIDIADGAITGSKIGPLAVNSTHINPNTIGSAHIVDNTVGTSDLSDLAVTNVKLMSNAVDSNKVLDNSIASVDILTRTITSSDIALETITSNEVLNESLTSADLGPNSVGASEVTDNSLTSAELAPNSVSSSEITDSSVTSTDIADATVGIWDFEIALPGTYTAVNATGTTETYPNSLIMRGASSTDSPSNGYSQCFLTATEILAVGGYCFAVNNGTNWGVKLNKARCSIVCI